MYSPAYVTRSATDAAPLLRAQTDVKAEGLGWRLREGEDTWWRIELTDTRAAPAQVWSEILAAVRALARTGPLRPLLVDLRGGRRPAGPALEACACVFASLERAGTRVATIVGNDCILAVRINHLIELHARRGGRCFHEARDAVIWIAHSPAAQS